MTSRTSKAICLLCFLVLALLFLGCASSTDSVQERDLVTKELKSDLEALDSRKPRMRARARDRIDALGPKVCRALAREVKARCETGETGPGFICLLRLLGAMGGEETWMTLGKAAVKRALAPSVRIEAVRALSTLGVAEATEALIECAGESEPLTLRLAALSALTPYAEREEVWGALLRHLALGAPSIRESAARALQDCREPGVRNHFLARLLDIHPGVRLLAVTYFNRFPFSGASSPLEALAARDSDIRVVMAAGKALAALAKLGK